METSYNVAHANHNASPFIVQLLLLRFKLHVTLITGDHLLVHYMIYTVIAHYRAESNLARPELNKPCYLLYTSKPKVLRLFDILLLDIMQYFKRDLTVRWSLRILQKHFWITLFDYLSFVHNNAVVSRINYCRYAM